MEVLF